VRIGRRHDIPTESRILVEFQVARRRLAESKLLEKGHEISRVGASNRVLNVCVKPSPSKLAQNSSTPIARSASVTCSNIGRVEIIAGPRGAEEPFVVIGDQFAVARHRRARQVVPASAARYRPSPAGRPRGVSSSHLVVAKAKSGTVSGRLMTGCWTPLVSSFTRSAM
jgi:hypothetical protein